MGRPARCHSRISSGSPNVAISEKGSAHGIFAEVQRCSQFSMQPFRNKDDDKKCQNMCIFKLENAIYLSIVDSKRAKVGHHGGSY